jgi:hypothetical protein
VIAIPAVAVDECWRRLEGFAGDVAELCRHLMGSRREGRREKKEETQERKERRRWYLYRKSESNKYS